MTQHLYTITDVQKVREVLLKEQDNLDKMTGLEIPQGKACLDHNHQTQFVRGVLHRQSNAALGKLEGIYTRYLSYWYPGTLSEFLRQAAAYIELEDDCRYMHPGFIKRLCINFASLNESSKKQALTQMNLAQGNNGSERKSIFRKAVLSRKYTFEQVNKIIEAARQ